MSSADQYVIGVIRWELPFIGVSSSWAHDTFRRWSLASQSHSPNASHHCSSHHNNHLYFHNHKLPQPLPSYTPVIAGWDTDPGSGRGNESIDGARGGGRTRVAKTHEQIQQTNSPKQSYSHYKCQQKQGHTGLHRNCKNIVCLLV